MTNSEDVKAAVEWFEGVASRSEERTAKTTPFDPIPGIATMHVALTRDAARIRTILAALTAAEQARDEAIAAAQILQAAVLERRRERDEAREALKRIDDTMAPTLRAWVHDRYGRRITWRTAWDFAASIINPAKES